MDFQIKITPELIQKIEQAQSEDQWKRILQNALAKKRSEILAEFTNNPDVHWSYLNTYPWEKD